MSAYFKTYLLVSLAFLCAGCSSKYVMQVSEYQYAYERIDSNLVEIDSATFYLVLPYKDSLDKTMNDVIAVSATKLTKAKPESSHEF